MTTFQLRFQPTLDKLAANQVLSRFLVTGAISDHDLTRRLIRLDRSYKAYIVSSPVPCWSPGLVVTNEIRHISETFLPFSEIMPAFARLVRLSLQGIQLPIAPIFERATCWLDLLHELASCCYDPDPAALLAQMMADEAKRRKFLFTLFVPKKYGGNFARYQGQQHFLRQWLKVAPPWRDGEVRCLDAACGSGEGSYELAELLFGEGVPSTAIHVTGITICALELLAAAYAIFPHDRVREERFRQYLRPLAEKNALTGISFAVGDLRTWETSHRYHIILCNGILGGPLLHDKEEVLNVVRRLAESLEPGGILLAADRFHGGWKKAMSPSELGCLFSACGLRTLEVDEGVGGLKR